jgi:hypothetical protein
MLLDKSIDLIDMAIVIYNDSSPAGFGYDQDWQRPLKREEVLTHPKITINENSGTLWMDYVNGRRCKCMVTNWVFKVAEYDSAHGQGAAKRLVSRVKKKPQRERIILTGETLEEARSKIPGALPPGSRILEEIVTGGTLKPESVTQFGDSPEEALQAARRLVHEKGRSAKIISEECTEEKSRVINKTGYCKVQEFTEKSAIRNAEMPTGALIAEVSLREQGNRGFLGFGRTPNTYQIKYYYSYNTTKFLAYVVYCLPASLEIIYEPPRFVEHGDGTATDIFTGLMWATGQEGTGLPYDQALVYCAQLNLAGHQDWRLPTKEELAILLKLDPNVRDQLFPGLQKERYWALTRDAELHFAPEPQSLAYTVDFDPSNRNYGAFITYYKTYEFFVCPVRKA